MLQFKSVEAVVALKMILFMLVLRLGKIQSEKEKWMLGICRKEKLLALVSGCK